MTNLENIAKLLLSRDEDNRELGRLLIDSQNIDEADLVQPMCKLAFNTFIQEYRSWFNGIGGFFREIIIVNRANHEFRLGVHYGRNYITVENGNTGRLVFKSKMIFDKNQNLVKPRELYRGIYLFFSSGIDDFFCGFTQLLAVGNRYISIRQRDRKALGDRLQICL